MTTLTTRAYAGEADLAALVGLLDACEAVDQLGTVTSAESLRADLCEPGFDPARDLRLWQDGDGMLLAAGRLWVAPPGEHSEVIVWLYVRPAARGGDLENQIMDWAAEQARTVAHQRGTPMRLRSHVRETQTERIALLERHGLRLARSFLHMACRLDGPLPKVAAPKGYTIRPLAGVTEAQAWANTYNASFGDHWNAHTAGPEYITHLIEHDPHYRADGNLAAIGPDGSLVGICYCAINPEEQDEYGTVGWVETLGVRQEHRRVGLGRALLTAGLGWLQSEGAASVQLSVDADSPTSATRLYTACGFQRVLINRVYLKEELL